MNPPPVTVSVSGVTLTNGSGTGGNNGNGGALLVLAGTTLTLTDSAVTNSRSQQFAGGGIYTAGNLTLNRVTVSGNHADGTDGAGGGIYHAGNVELARLLSITNSTISGNTTSGNGGGIFSTGQGLGLQSTTIAGNTAVNGSGLFKNALRQRDPGLDHRRHQRHRLCGRGRRSVHRQQQSRDRRDVLGRRGRRPGPRRAREQRRSDGHARPRSARARRSELPAPLRIAAPERISAASPRPQGGTCDIGAYELVGSAPQPGGGTQPPPDDELPPPEAGKTVNALPARGTVKIRVPGTNRFVELEEGRQIPVGTVVDTLKGRVTLVAAGGQEATFYDGIFKIGQGKAARPRTTLTLSRSSAARRRATRSRRPRRRRSGAYGATAAASSAPRASTAPRRSSAPSGSSRIAAPPRSLVWCAAGCRYATSKPRRRSPCAAASATSHVPSDPSNRPGLLDAGALLQEHRS